TAATYTLTSADVDTTIRVAVTATNAGGSTTAVSAATGTAEPVAPVNTAPPAITGTARDGSTLAVGQGSWTGTPTIAYGYQWRRCDASGDGCADIAGTTGTSYELAGTDVGKTIRAVVTATNAAGGTAAATAATAAVDPLAPASTTAPTISGTPSDGSTLSATTGAWSGTAPI